MRASWDQSGPDPKNSAPLGNLTKIIPIRVHVKYASCGGSFVMFFFCCLNLLSLFIAISVSDE